MKALRAFVACLYCLWPVVAGTSLAAPPPVITSVSPAPLTTFSYHTSFALTINGNNFWPGGPNNPDRWQILVRRQYMPFQTFRGTNASNNLLRFEFDSFPLLSVVGQLEVMVKVDGVSSNIFAVKILNVPPSLIWVMPNEIPLNGSDPARWNLWLCGDHWLTKSTIWINGAQAAEMYNYGKQALVWPAGLRKVGTYGVQVRNERGSSEVRNVQVLAPTPFIKATTEVKEKGDLYKVLVPTHTPTPAFAALKKTSNAFGAVVAPTNTPNPAVKSLAATSGALRVPTKTHTPTPRP